MRELSDKVFQLLETARRIPSSLDYDIWFGLLDKIDADLYYRIQQGTMGLHEFQNHLNSLIEEDIRKTV
jgi:hypothetical protein